MKKMLLAIILAGLCSVVVAQTNIMDNTNNLSKDPTAADQLIESDIAIVFTTNAVPYNLSSVTLVLFFWSETTVDVTFSIMLANGSNEPTGSVLASETFNNQTIPSTAAYKTFTFSSLNSFTFNANTKYALVASTNEAAYFVDCDGTLLPTSSYYTVHRTLLNSGSWNDFNYFAIRVMGTDNSLPVQLAAFSAKSQGNSVILDWVTESETDNLGFILERSDDEISWQTIASYQTHPELLGQGSTSSRTEYVFTDNGIDPGKTYFYRLSDISTNGEISDYLFVSVKTDKLPVTTEMDNAYPNPFNPQTKIAYNLATDTNVSITVFDLLGRKIESLYNGYQAAGSHHVYWNATNATNVPSGCYIVRMQTEHTTQTQKVLLMK